MFHEQADHSPPYSESSRWARESMEEARDLLSMSYTRPQSSQSMRSMLEYSNEEMYHPPITAASSAANLLGQSSASTLLNTPYDEGYQPISTYLEPETPPPSPLYTYKSLFSSHAYPTPCATPPFRPDAPKSSFHMQSALKGNRMSDSDTFFTVEQGLFCEATADLRCAIDRLAEEMRATRLLHREHITQAQEAQQLRQTVIWKEMALAKAAQREAVAEQIGEERSTTVIKPEAVHPIPNTIITTYNPKRTIEKKATDQKYPTIINTTTPPLSTEQLPLLAIGNKQDESQALTKNNCFGRSETTASSDMRRNDENRDTNSESRALTAMEQKHTEMEALERVLAAERRSQERAEQDRLKAEKKRLESAQLDSIRAHILRRKIQVFGDRAKRKREEEEEEEEEEEKEEEEEATCGGELEMIRWSRENSLEPEGLRVETRSSSRTLSEGSRASDESGPLSYQY